MFMKPDVKKFPPGLFKLLLNGASVEVANGRDVSASTIVLNGGPPAVAGATVVIEMGMATGMR